MKMKRTGYNALAMGLAVCALLSITVFSFAEEGGPPSDEPEVIVEPDPTPAPTSTSSPTPTPKPSPTSTPKPSSTPAPAGPTVTSEQKEAAEKTWSKDEDGNLHYSGSESFQEDYGYQPPEEIPGEEFSKEDPDDEGPKSEMDSGWHRDNDGNFAYNAYNVSTEATKTSIRARLSQLSGVPTSSSSASSKKGQSG